MFLDDYMETDLSYQKVMEATDGLDPAVYPLVGTAQGRWIHMRGSLQAAGELADAEQAGLCQCWPAKNCSASSVFITEADYDHTTRTLFKRIRYY